MGQAGEGSKRGTTDRVGGEGGGTSERASKAEMLHTHTHTHTHLEWYIPGFSSTVGGWVKLTCCDRDTHIRRRLMRARRKEGLMLMVAKHADGGHSDWHRARQPRHAMPYTRLVWVRS